MHHSDAVIRDFSFFKTSSYGTTRSYAAQAVVMVIPASTRTVANANGANQLAIVIPCHRILTAMARLAVMEEEFQGKSGCYNMRRDFKKRGESLLVDLKKPKNRPQ